MMLGRPRYVFAAWAFPSDTSREMLMVPVEIGSSRRPVRLFSYCRVIGLAQRRASQRAADEATPVPVGLDRAKQANPSGRG
jgi:hypothetical protein